jgi:hypothetical protein
VSTHPTKSDNPHDTGAFTAGTAEASNDRGNPTVITAPATGKASGFATSETTGTDPKTASETGMVPI